MACRRVDLPEPFGPTSDVTRPAGIDNVSTRSATAAPRRSTRPVAPTAGGDGTGCAAETTMPTVVDMRPILTSIAVGLLSTLATAGCGDEAGGSATGTPVVVVTSTILGDIVETLAGDAAEVEVLLPRGADPHDFSPSVRQAEAMSRA